MAIGAKGLHLISPGAFLLAPTNDVIGFPAVVQVLTAKRAASVECGIQTCACVAPKQTGFIPGFLIHVFLFLLIKNEHES